MLTPERVDEGFRWHVSTYSPNTGGNCVEVGWRVRSYSANTSGNCVEVGPLNGDARVAVRDSKNRGGGMLVTTTRAWAAFVRGVR